MSLILKKIIIFVVEIYDYDSKYITAIEPAIQRGITR
jgi:hypothetical protein